eukprot:g6500.t1
MILTRSGSLFFSCLNPPARTTADGSSSVNKAYHMGNLALLALAPAAIVLHPSPLSMPIDCVLAIALPFHGHVGMNYIISDYIPKGGRGAARGLMLLASGATAVGLLSLSVSGDGIVGSLKQLWRGGKPAPAAAVVEEEE